jgi:hypothetical protein
MYIVIVCQIFRLKINKRTSFGQICVHIILIYFQNLFVPLPKTLKVFYYEFQNFHRNGTIAFRCVKSMSTKYSIVVYGSVLAPLPLFSDGLAS